MSGKVKWFTSSNINAPTLDNNWGALVNVLSKCLIDGYGAQTLLNIVIENGVAIASFGTAHKFEMFQWVEISGSSNSVLNDEFRILGATPTTIEFLIDLPDQTITETLSCRLAPLGWSKPYSDEGRAVFQAKDTDKNPYFLRIDDTCDPLHNPTYAKFAKVGILETCTGIDDIGGAQAPFDPLLPTKNWIGTGSYNSSSAIIGWAKWIYAISDSTNSSGVIIPGLYGAPPNGNKNWMLVGDDENFYIFPANRITTSSSAYKSYASCFGFGIFDGRDCPFLAAQHRYSSINSQMYPGANRTFASMNYGYLILLKNRDGSYVTTSQIDVNHETRLKYGLGGPNPSGGLNIYIPDAEDGIYFNPFYARDVKGAYLGTMPLLQCVLQATPSLTNMVTAFNDGSNALLLCCHEGDDRVYGSIIIDLGKIQ